MYFFGINFSKKLKNVYVNVIIRTFICSFLLQQHASTHCSVDVVGYSSLGPRSSGDTGELSGSSMFEATSRIRRNSVLRYPDVALTPTSSTAATRRPLALRLR